jgi:branched-chain amino acid transport system substrate-binding protein
MILVFKRSLLCLALAGVLVGCSGDNATLPIDNSVVYGALLDLSGPGKTLGVTSRAALDIALDSNFLVEDTGLVPDNALAGLMRLKEQGVKVVFGPQSSSELAACKAFADANGMILISMGSTASSLSIPNDDVLRFCPPDTREIEAVVAYLEDTGKTGIVPVWRNDVGNNGLVSQLKTQFPTAGGTVSDGFMYGTETTDFSAAVNAATNQATALRGTLGNNVALYFGSFDEAADLAAAFPNTDVPGQIAIGGDGMAKAASFLAPGATAARDFARRNNLVAPTFGLDPAQQPIWGPLSTQIKNMSGEDPDAFALAAYDSAVIAQQAVNSTGTVNATALRNAIINLADAHVGATGLNRLDANGDRASSTFDFYGLNDTPAWVVKASYRNGVIVRP